MDYFALIEKELNELKGKIINYIRAVLCGEKCYSAGDKIKTYNEKEGCYYVFAVENGNILYGEYYEDDSFYRYCKNIEWCTIDELKDLLHDAYHVLPKY